MPPATHARLTGIGGGPAGLPTGLLFAPTGTPLVSHGSGRCRSAGVASWHTIPTFDREDPAACRAATLAGVRQFPDAGVRAGAGLRATGSNANVLAARRVVLATGAGDVLSAIPTPTPTRPRVRLAAPQPAACTRAGLGPVPPCRCAAPRPTSRHRPAPAHPPAGPQHTWDRCVGCIFCPGHHMGGGRG